MTRPRGGRGGSKGPAVTSCACPHPVDVGLRPEELPADVSEMLAKSSPPSNYWSGKSNGGQDGGAYTIVVYIRPSATVPGALQLVDGTAHFKRADGSTGTLTLNVDGKGKQVMKWVRDDGQRTAEYEPVK